MKPHHLRAKVFSSLFQIFGFYVQIFILLSNSVPLSSLFSAIIDWCFVHSVKTDKNLKLFDMRTWLKKIAAFLKNV